MSNKAVWLQTVATGWAALTMASIASLANGNASFSSAGQLDNTTNLYLDALVVVQLSQSASAVANDKAFYVYAYGSDGTNYPEGITGTDAGYTILGSAGALTTALRLIGVIPAVASDTNYHGPFAVAPAFGGVLPPKWGLVFLNFGGQTLAGSGNAATYTAIAATVA